MVLVPETQVLSALVATSALMAILWLVQRRTGNAGIVDAGWAASIGLLSIFFVNTSGGYLPRRVLVATLIGIWAARLAIYLLRDRVLGCPEVGRYRTLRAKWGATAQRRLFVFFQTQALAALFFSLPVLVIAHHRVARWTAWDLAGAIIWCVSVVNTILADRQLARFKRRPDSRGKTCREGWCRLAAIQQVMANAAYGNAPALRRGHRGDGGRLVPIGPLIATGCPVATSLAARRNPTGKT